MKKQAVLIFDLDGTIADSLQTVIQIYNKEVAPPLGCKTVDFEDRYLLHNQPIRQIFKAYDIKWYKLPFVIYLVRKHLQKQIKNVQPFPSISSVLHQLKKNYKLGIVTSNSQHNAHQFLNQHSLMHLFDFVYSNRNIYGKHNTLNKLISKYQFKKSNILYIGDETRDIQAARKAGIGVMAVSWGFLGKELLAKKNPDILIDQPDQLTAAVESYFNGSTKSIKKELTFSKKASS